MDRVYRLQRHIYNLTRKYYLLGRDRLIGELDVPAGGSVLEIGCGTGRNLIAIARRYPQAAVYGLDISALMLRTAARSAARAGVTHRVRLAQADAASFEPTSLFGRDRFDRVFFSYSLSMIPDWRGALASAALLVAKGGELRLVDFGQMERLPRWFRDAMFAWLSRFHVTPRADLADALRRSADVCGGRLSFTSILGDYARLGRAVL